MIEIKITADTMEEAVNQIAGFADNPTEKKIKNQTKEAPKEVVKEKLTHVELSEETPRNDASTEVDAHVPDAVELRAAAQTKAKMPEGKIAIKELLQKYESASISTIPEDKRTAFLRDVEAL